LLVTAILAVAVPWER